MGLKSGFKKTFVGKVPLDWIDCEFQDVMAGFTSGATPYRGRSEFYKGNIRWITSGELNYNVITDTVEKITEEAVKQTNLKIHPPGTFLFAITGLEAEGTRGSCAIVGADSATNQSCMALFPKENLDNGYLYHYYIWQGDNLAFKYCQGTKQQSYTATIAKKLPIVLPPTKAEQTAIATALSDIDALISSLEKIIAKKRNIKQGVIQCLLIPKKSWTVEKLGALTLFHKQGYYTQESYNLNGKYYLLRGTDMQNPTIDLSTTPKIDANQNDFGSYKVLKGDFLFVRSGAIGRYGIVKEDMQALFGSYLINFRFDKTKLLNEYFGYFYQSENASLQLKMIMQGGGNININAENIKSLIIPLPPVNEQEYTVNILSDMDAELTSLEKKLEKQYHLKQSMMQTLLTGKIRLV